MPRTKRTTGRASKALAPAGKPGRVAVAYRLPAELVARLSRTAWHLQGPPLVLRAVDVIEAGLLHELDRLERAHNKGRPFPPIPEGRRMRGGRRPGTGAGS